VDRLGTLGLFAVDGKVDCLGIDTMDGDQGYFELSLEGDCQNGIDSEYLTVTFL